MGIVNEEDYRFLEKRFCSNLKKLPGETIYITPTNNLRKEINKEKLIENKNPVFLVKSRVSGDNFLKNNNSFPEKTTTQQVLAKTKYEF